MNITGRAQTTEESHEVQRRAWTFGKMETGGHTSPDAGSAGDSTRSDRGGQPGSSSLQRYRREHSSEIGNEASTELCLGGTHEQGLGVRCSGLRVRWLATDNDSLPANGKFQFETIVARPAIRPLVQILT